MMTSFDGHLQKMAYAPPKLFTNTYLLSNSSHCQPKAQGASAKMPTRSYKKPGIVRPSLHFSRPLLGDSSEGL
jgi:hypothetical protein